MALPPALTIKKPGRLAASRLYSLLGQVQSEHPLRKAIDRFAGVTATLKMSGARIVSSAPSPAGSALRRYFLLITTGKVSDASWPPTLTVAVTRAVAVGFCGVKVKATL